MTLCDRAVFQSINTRKQVNGYPDDNSGMAVRKALLYRSEKLRSTGGWLVPYRAAVALSPIRPFSTVDGFSLGSVKLSINRCNSIRRSAENVALSGKRKTP